MCLFCDIAAGKIPSDVVFQNQRLTAFRDIKPGAPVHILVIPNEHVPSVKEAGPEHAVLIGEMALTAAELAKREGISESGFRLVFNSGADAGQSVDHIHMHLLGGRAMQWPPG